MTRTILTKILITIVITISGCTLKKTSESGLRTNQKNINKQDIFHSKIVSDDLFELRKRIPLVLLCQKGKSLDTRKPFDLVFRLRDFESRKYSQISTTLNLIDSWVVVLDSLDDEQISANDTMNFSRKSSDDGKFLNFVYYPFKGNRNNAYFMANTNPNGTAAYTEDRTCALGSKLSERSPKASEELIISGRDASGKFVSQAISVDLLFKDEKDGREKILSVSKAYEGWATIGEPVFNKSNELVGFVESYSPGSSFGITIRSVHDRTFGAQVNDWVAQKNWKPLEPKDTDRGPSKNIVSTCLCIARDANPPRGALDWLYRACQSYVKFGYP